ncbi:MAG: hypothetical protein A4E57_00759 [Syntrophorhabdaceae bacterium PtaU1.Bin034]|nr:MAG: hypothetical protein A4E57_00759 [Syntrophorhabdaceae bacterium PtaU1.Bin034]
MFNASHLIQPVSMIVLTGGPCSGKSSSLAYLTERLSDHGFMVFVIPETATLITDNGIDRRKMDRASQVALYEEAILDMQLSFEETYARTVSRIFPERKKVILLDRGVMDIKAFVPEKTFKSMLARKGLKEIELRDRYNGVIHLVTAAEGAEDFYTGENNGARIETAEEAIRIDVKIRESWLGHPHFKVIDNRTDFDGKIRRTYATIMQFLGLPALSSIQERYLIEEVADKDLPAHQVIEIEQVFLRSRSRGEEIELRKRGQEGSHLYFLKRTRTSDRHGVKAEELISEQQYLNLKKLMDSKTDVVTKDRICFLWNNQHFELDRYKGRHSGLCTMEVEPADIPGEGTKIQIPPFITIRKNITSNSRYRERNLATKKRGPR